MRAGTKLRDVAKLSEEMWGKLSEEVWVKLSEAMGAKLSEGMRDKKYKRISANLG